MLACGLDRQTSRCPFWEVMSLLNRLRDAQFGPADTKLAAAAGMEDKTESVKHNLVNSLGRLAPYGRTRA